MPPEFIDLQIISKEFDIFSLGVIIVEVMLGDMGFSRLWEMGNRDFIHHVRNVDFRTLIN